MKPSSGSNKSPQGILLIQLGSPQSPETRDVRNFLKEFLNDPRVMDIPGLLRFLLLNLIILPFRSKKSAANYRKIWSTAGSPLTVHSYALKEKLQEKIDRKSKGNYKIKLAMRYGEPSIKKSFIEFAQEGISQIKIFPLFPQYASATTGSVLQEIFDSISRKLNIPNIEIVPPYFDHPSYIQAKSQIILEYLKKKKKYINKFFFLFSFHGLPQRQVKNADKSGSHCLVKERCCEQITASNLFCYRAHCTKTAHELAKFLKLKNERWSLSFQSRLGRAEWLKPYTTQVIRELAENGTQNLLVVSPSFTADGLETLEELGMQEKNNFLRAGGKEFLLAPCLNNHPAWVDAILKIILK